MAKLYQPPKQNALQFTLDSAYTAGNTTLTLNQDVSTLVQAPGVCVVDRIDSSGNKTSTKRDYFTFTGVSGVQLTGVTGGLAGSTNQNHSVGAIVEFIPDIIQQQAIYDVVTTEHSVMGQHTSLPSVSLLATQALTFLSAASGMLVNTRNLVSASQASLAFVNIGSLLNASGASYQALPVRPVWVMAGLLSGATTGAGKPLTMTDTAAFQYFTAVTRTAVSGSSLSINVLKNNTSIFDTGTRPVILSSGTFVSTASILTKGFVPGDVFTVDLNITGGFFNDVTLIGYAR